MKCTKNEFIDKILNKEWVPAKLDGLDRPIAKKFNQEERNYIKHDISDRKWEELKRYYTSGPYWRILDKETGEVIEIE